MITTTLNRIREHDPCKCGWEKLLKYLGKTQADDEPLPFSVIVESNGIQDALWCCRAEPQHSKVWRLYAVWCARKVQHLMRDERSIAALDFAERHANGLATDDELRAARDAALYTVLGSAMDSSWAVAWEAAMDAARYAARASAWDAAWNAARDATRDAAWNAARDAARDAQTKRFLEVVS